MKSDSKALLKVFGCCFALAIAAVGIGWASAAGWLPRDQAASWMLGVIVVGGIGLGLWFGPALMRPPSNDKPRAKK
jgi:hypothetical protein